jgi:hypothetical protein
VNCLKKPLYEFPYICSTIFTSIHCMLEISLQLEVGECSWSLETKIHEYETHTLNLGYDIYKSKLMV